MKLLILGAGQYGQLVKELARNHYTTIDFLDDNSNVAIAPLNSYKELKEEYQNAIVAIGNNDVRMEWLEKLETEGYNIPTLISDKAYGSPSSEVAKGCIVEPMVSINTAAKIEKGSIISSGAVVNHNSIVKFGCHIDCNAVVGAGAIVPEKTNIAYGQVIRKVARPEGWEFSE